jgi:hypothetical protein
VDNTTVETASAYDTHHTLAVTLSLALGAHRLALAMLTALSELALNATLATVVLVALGVLSAAVAAVRRWAQHSREEGAADSASGCAKCNTEACTECERVTIGTASAQLSSTHHTLAVALSLSLGAGLLVVTDAVGAAEAGGAADATLAAVFNVALEVLRREQAGGRQQGSTGRCAS